MAIGNRAYPPEFRQQIVELVKSARTPNELPREYEPSAGPSTTGCPSMSATEGSAATV